MKEEILQTFEGTIKITEIKGWFGKKQILTKIIPYKNLNRPNKILKALEILEDIGIEVRELHCDKELIKQMRKNRKEIDKATRYYEETEIIDLPENIEFDDFLDVKSDFLEKSKLKVLGNKFEGMIFGVRLFRK